MPTSEPTVTRESTREQLIAWLIWNDRNGVYSDSDSAIHGYEPLTCDEALRNVTDMRGFEK